MIEDPPLLTVRRRFARPTRAQLDAFAGVPTGFVADAMNGRGALDARIKPIGRTPASFHGVAITCHAGPADNLALFGALAHGEPGDVMVCATDGFAETAVTGDLLLGMARNRGLAGFVTDGMVRDVPGIEAVGLPCFAAGVTPNSPVRNGPGTVGMPVVLGGVAVGSGDIVVGDGDGIVVVPFAAIEAVIARLVAVKAAEAALDAKVRGGLQLPNFIRAMMDAGRFREVD
ncbi:MAG: RraA family protein [Alphaproteobacteria bacterium]|nr:RraA family protein [Alphaproteobacteria bacterium]